MTFNRQTSLMLDAVIILLEAPQPFLIRLALQRRLERDIPAWQSR